MLPATATQVSGAALVVTVHKHRVGWVRCPRVGDSMEHMLLAPTSDGFTNVRPRISFDLKLPQIYPHATTSCTSLHAARVRSFGGPCNSVLFWRHDRTMGRLLADRQEASADLGSNTRGEPAENQLEGYPKAQSSTINRDTHEDTAPANFPKAIFITGGLSAPIDNWDSEHPSLEA